MGQRVAYKKEHDHIIPAFSDNFFYVEFFLYYCIHIGIALRKNILDKRISEEASSLVIEHFCLICITKPGNSNENLVDDKE